jgi:hypothetical protein
MTVSAIYQNKEETLVLPSQMSELRQEIWRSSVFVKAVLAMDDTRIRVAILAHYYPAYYRMMSTQQVVDILAAWDIKADYDAMAPMPGWSYFYLQYVAPPKDFATGTLREWIYMDEYLEEMDIPALTALLYRRPADDATALRKDDRRTPLIGRDQVSLWAKSIKRHSYLKKVQAMQASALLYAIGVKQLVHELYGSRLFGGEATTTHNLGWMAVAMQIAEQGVFGDYEHVLDTTLHEVLAYMLVKKSESETQEVKNG